MDTGDDYPLPPGDAAAERRNTGDASPPNAGTANSHQRVYQACIPCRQRKVKCDLGSVDNPHDPPCSRCRRESKQCFFASERRKKRKTGDHPGPEESDEGIFEIRNGTRKRVKASEERDPIRDGEDLERPRTPGGSLGQARPLQRPNAGKPVQYKEEDERASEHTTALLQHRELHSGHDALNMLHAAATTIQNRAIGDGRAAFASPGGGQFSSTTSPIPGGAGNGSFSGTSAPIAQRNGAVADRSMGVSSTYNPTEPSAEYTSAVRAWQRFRFVRAGWFTADEGIEYISYFYTHLAPLTPVALPNFRSLETHKKLLEEETMLALTMLLIASRHMRLNGPGSNSRPYAIHDTLWTYLSGMIARVMWGQEQFGGGFCGAGNQPGCDVNPLHRKGMRTLGSVESLVLLTEWHPRAMHFPPAQDDSELMQPEPIQVISDTADLNTASKGIGGQRMDAWLEPCWRSDRMCWMLLGLAMTLAFEIGIFDSSEWQRHTRTLYGQTLSPDELDAYNRRRGNVRDLLLVYVTQTSGRLGLTSMLPSSYNDPEGSKLHNKQIGPLDSIQDATLHFWLRMASLMKQGNTKIFPNKDATRNLIRTRKYREVLAELQIPLEQWRKDFDRCKQIPKVMRSILLIEWEYARAYVNSLSLQAVAERCARDDVHPMDPPLEMARSVSKSGDIPMTPSALSKHFSGERHFLVKVAESARSLLKIVVDDLYPNDYLKHAPVRTYFRIISVAILMFKTFVLGAFESDISGSLGLLVKTIDALRTCIVDDVHVASRFAELLETLTNNLKPRLVRMAADGRGGKPLRSRRGSSHGSPLLQADVAATNNGNYTGPQSQYPAQQLPAAMSNSTPWSPNLVSPANIPGSNHPLLGVSDDTYDLTANNNSWSIMPPPGFNNHSPNNNSNNTMGSGASGTYDTYATDTFGMSNDQDWFALPMDPLLSLSGTDVTHTQFGPDIGGHDMLELLLNGSNGFQ